MPREYEECYVAVLDLLGFKDKIITSSCEEIASIYDKMHEKYYIRKDDLPLIDDGELHKMILSDTIVFYIKTTVKNALAALIATCSFFQIELLSVNSPTLLRGAIVKGNIYREGSIVFGQGIVDAYLLEENVAKYPRIILQKKIVEEYTNFDKEVSDFKDWFLFEDFDLFYSIDYLFQFYSMRGEKGSWKKFAKHVYDVIDCEMSPSIREKYIYVYDLIGKAIDKHRDYRNNNKLN